MRWKCKNDREWNKYFAFFPVKVGDDWVWLEYLEGRTVWSGLYWEYRLIKS
jgi:hypothetical protein